MKKKTKKPLDIKVSVRNYSKNISFAGSPGANSSSGFYGNSANSSS